MKSQKNILMIASLWLVIGFLAEAALAATAESRNSLDSDGPTATLTPTIKPTSQVSSGNCLGSNCLANGVTTLNGAHISPGIWNSGLSANRTLSVFNISSLNGPSTGPITLEDGIQRNETTPSNSALTFTSRNSQPQLHFTAASVKSGIAAPYPQASTGRLGSIINQLFCSSPSRKDCLSDALFNSYPMNKSAPTAKVILAPEPTAAFLLGTGLLALGLMRRRKNKPY